MSFTSRQKRNEDKLRLLIYFAETKATSEASNLSKNSNSLKPQNMPVKILEGRRVNI